MAIKKIEKAFDQRIFTKRTLRELKLLRLLDHEHVIIINYILFQKKKKETIFINVSF